MRKIEVRTVEGFKAVYVDDEYTGMHYTTEDMNAMLDDLMDTPGLASQAAGGRNGLLAELVTKTLARCPSSESLDKGPLTADELKEIIRMVGKSCKKGWFS